ncbi:MAG TPA: tRNA 2-thiocytidine biosynthesis TtcA family protein [Syntrophomonas sp.]|nr:tRNA 2-thiocytidine biosynthesis TtcA family protein [Syntrophomonas sp.]
MNKTLNKKIFRDVRRANLKYKMVETGDRIAVGLSGGKDSTALLYFLSMLQQYTPLDFTLVPIYLDLGFDNDDSPLQQVCADLQLPLLVEKTNIGTIVFDIRQEKNPCSLCSNLRRGALNRVAKRNNCNKVALGHHADDAVDTLLMSMIFEGRYHLFKPVTYLDRIDITVIRPMILVSEQDIKRFCSSIAFLPVENRCPADGLTKREEIKTILADIESRCPGARQRILTSIANVDANSFWTAAP